MISRNSDLDRRYEYSKRAANDFAKKIRLESGFKRDLKDFFNRLADKFRSTYSSVGQIPPANIYQNELKGILDKNYVVISKTFESQVRTYIKSFSQVEFKGMDDDIKSTINGYIAKHSKEQSQIITDTNQEEMAVSVMKVKKEALEKGYVLSNKEIADQAYLIFKKRSLGRIDTIATTETQNISETTKYIEATFVEQNIINGLYKIRGKAVENTKPDVMKKTWITILDERTRLSHVLADEQQQPNDTPFVVEGEKLMTPGDSSLGASVENIINCRCSCIYDVDKVILDSLQKPTILQNIADIFSGRSKNKDIDQNQIVNNLIKGIPNGENPNVIITHQNGKEYAFVKGILGTTGKVSKNGRVIEVGGFGKRTGRIYNGDGTTVSVKVYDKDGKGENIGYYLANQLKADDDNIYGGAYISLSNKRGKEVFEQIRKGEVTGFSNSLDYDDKNLVRTLTLDEARKEGYDLSYLNPGVDKIEVYSTAQVEVIQPAISGKNAFENINFDKIDINKPLPPGVTSLESELFVVPENIKKGENITIVNVNDALIPKRYGFVRGYSVVFDNTTDNRGIVPKEAMKLAIEEDIKNNVKSYPMFYNHETADDKLLGYYPLKNMVVDDYGLYVEGFVDIDTALGRKIYTEAKEGKVPAFSIGFTVRGEEIIQDVAYYNRLNMREISVVDVPANSKSVMMPVIGPEAQTRRSVGKDIIVPEFFKPNIKIDDIKNITTQKQLDDYLEGVKSRDGYDYGKISIDNIKKMSTQQQLDNFLNAIHESSGIDFYTRLTPRIEINDKQAEQIAKLVKISKDNSIDIVPLIEYSLDVNNTQAKALYNAFQEYIDKAVNN